MNEIVKIAKAAVEQQIKDHTRYEPKDYPKELNKIGASFVTLTENNQLRGCIGTLEAHEPLIDNIITNAINAATHDPRFERVSKDELNDLEYEVSILTEPKPIDFCDKAELIEKITNKGVILTHGPRSATFLPQVWEQFPDDPLGFLEALSNKMGLDSDAWKESKVEIYEVKILE